MDTFPPGRAAAKTLVITNDFPPRIGGIESFVADVCRLLDDEVVVLTSDHPGAQSHDATLPYPVVRRGPVLLPTSATLRTATDLVSTHHATRVVYGAMAPLALLAGRLRRTGVERQLGLTHGHEVWWATLPGSRIALRRMGQDLDHVATISDYAAARIAPALSSAARERMIRLAPPIDLDRFRPGPPRAEGDRPRCVAVSRFVTQKGLQTLLDAWVIVLAAWTGPQQPELVLVGDGALDARLRARARDLDLDLRTSAQVQDVTTTTVRFTGPLPRAEVVAQLQSADLFALPVRTRLAGLNPEGLGLGFIEAAACGLPVVVGDSGGAPETVVHGETGYVVDPLDADALADRIGELLRDEDRARRMGAAGRAHVRERYGLDQARTTLRTALALD